jgi:hypothetical protein
LKQVSKLQRLLEPRAHVHREHDAIFLTKCVAEVEALFYQLPPQKRSQLEADMAIAVKAILQRQLNTTSVVPQIM